MIDTVAGTGLRGDSGDGDQAISAALNSPRGVAVDGSGNVYIADTGNRRIRRVTVSGVIETLGPAQWESPTGLAVAPDGTLLVTDAGTERIRRLEGSGSAGTVEETGRQGIRATTVRRCRPH